MADGSWVTPEMIALFKKAEALRWGVETWEEDGGTRRTFMNLSSELHTLLGRHVWEDDVMRCVPPAGSHDTTHKIYAALARAAANEGTTHV
jgi:hypothetical protein